MKLAIIQRIRLYNIIAPLLVSPVHAGMRREAAINVLLPLQALKISFLRPRHFHCRKWHRRWYGALKAVACDIYILERA